MSPLCNLFSSVVNYAVPLTRWMDRLMATGFVTDLQRPAKTPPPPRPSCEFTTPVCAGSGDSDFLIGALSQFLAASSSAHKVIDLSNQLITIDASSLTPFFSFCFFYPKRRIPPTCSTLLSTASKSLCQEPYHRPVTTVIAPRAVSPPTSSTSWQRRPLLMTPTRPRLP